MDTSESSAKGHIRKSTMSVISNYQAMGCL